MFKVVLMNKDGYTISKQFYYVESCMNFAQYYDLSQFFGWIYDIKNDEVVFQNCYSNKWEKCDNWSFIPYY